MSKRIFLAAAAVFIVFPLFAQKTYSLSSPDGSLTTNIVVGKTLTFNISHEGTEILAPSQIGIERANGVVWGKDAKVQKASKSSVSSKIASPFYRHSEVEDNHNGLVLKMKGGWSLEFRAYNDGIAYRFVNGLKETMAIKNEIAEYNFPTDASVAIPYVRKGKDGDFTSQFFNSFENYYKVSPLSKCRADRLAFLPLTVDGTDDVRMCFTEVNLNDYPGMYLLNPDGGQHLIAKFAPYPAAFKQGGHNNLEMLVTKSEDYIAKVVEPRTFPWRVAVVGNDVEIAGSNLSYILADESKIEDISWIRPGKVAWEWWNAWNLGGVDFKAGINNDTYKYYIDFASKNGIEYVILDEGWAVNLEADLFKIVPEIDMKGLVEYGNQKGVGLILWAGYQAFDRDMEKVCKHYSQMGIKGFKVDFMDRDDQVMTGFNYRAAQMAAKYHLVLDLHGTHKPAGLNRTWPNVLNVEGVNGLEQLKWTKNPDQVRYDATLPFIRQVSGPMDYTQGAMKNATKKTFLANNDEPMSQGTRCHQLGLYVVLDSPLNMLCDSPTNYLKEQECTDFIAAIPTVWDETKILAGKMGEYIVTARRSANTWYIGGISNWDSREVEVNLSTLGISATSAEAFIDGVNADRRASDYKRTTLSIDPSKPLRLSLAPGGGFVLIVR